MAPYMNYLVNYLGTLEDISSTAPRIRNILHCTKWEYFIFISMLMVVVAVSFQAWKPVLFFLIALSCS
jgi:hypothetical protein